MSANGLYFVALWNSWICTWYVRSEEFRQAMWSKCWTCDFSKHAPIWKKKYYWNLLQPLISKQKKWWGVLSFFFLFEEVYLTFIKSKIRNPNKLWEENASPNTYTLYYCKREYQLLITPRRMLMSAYTAFILL